MANQTTTLLLKLKKAVEKMEKELLECKEIICQIEVKIAEESSIIEKAKPAIRSSKTKSASVSIERNLIVDKIEVEFKENKFDTLSWLVSTKSKINREDIISLFQEKNIILDKSLNKNKISDEVKRILSNRYSFSKS